MGAAGIKGAAGVEGEACIEGVDGAAGIEGAAGDEGAAAVAHQQGPFLKRPPERQRTALLSQPL